MSRPSIDSRAESAEPLSRRALIQRGVGAGLAVALAPMARLVALPAPFGTAGAEAAPSAPGALILRTIPSSGEQLPAIGIGTARRYDVTTAEEKAPLLETLRLFPTLGGKVIDTAPSYGQAEPVTGELVEQLGIRDQLFLATKVSVRGTDPAPGVAQMAESFRRLRTKRIDLMQVWNLGGTATLLPVLREMKQAGTIRYIGVTTSSEQQYPALEALLKAELLDFVQVDYAADNREAADRILPLAKDRGAGVLINLPFGRSRVFQNVLSTPVPEWAKEFEATTWAQIFLKYIVAHPAVTCVIPGTAQEKYVRDNMGAAHGALPDAALLRKIEAAVAKAM
jgi:aryl-alcohol dehydrogenase-like predicted oxidoreductase